MDRLLPCAVCTRDIYARIVAAKMSSTHIFCSGAKVASLLSCTTVTACKSQIDDCICDTANTLSLLTMNGLYLVLLVTDFQGIQHRFDHEVPTLYEEQAS